MRRRPFFPWDASDRGWREGRAGSTLLRCPVCGEVVYEQLYGDMRPLEVIAAEGERSARRHLADRHRARLWLYDRFGWRWPLRGPL